MLATVYVLGTVICLLPQKGRVTLAATPHEKRTAVVPFMISLLHISDYHAGGTQEGQPYLRKRVLGQPWLRNLDTLQEQGAIHFVVFTGDCANRGKASEYAQLSDFLGETCARLGLGLQHVFPVPGNHDIDRSLQAEPWQKLRELALQADPADFSAWMAGQRNLKGFDNGWRDGILSRQQAYRDWVTSLANPAIVQEPAGLGYRASLELHGLPLHLIGLDSAWLCGDDADAGKIWLTQDQIYTRCTDETGDKLPGIRVALMHHPLEQLADFQPSRRILAEHVDLVLHGHLHGSDSFNQVMPDTQLRILVAGCLFEGHKKDRWPNACHKISFKPGPQLEVAVRLRAFAPDAVGHWHDDNSRFEVADRGLLNFSIQRDLSAFAAAATVSFDPYKPAEGNRFVGRVEPLQQLTSAINKGDSVSLVGDWRIGKSSLLAAFGRQQQALGTVRLLSGEGAESASLGRFVAAITGCQPEAAAEPDRAADLLASWARQETVRGQAPLLLMDEFETIAVRFERRFFERLRGMLDRVRLVVSSRQSLQLLYEQANLTSPFYNRLELVTLGLLPQNEVAALTVQLGAGLSSSARELLMQQAGGHPYYLNLLGKYLLETDQAQALDRFYQNAVRSLSDLWRHLKEKEKRDLLATLTGTPCRGVNYRLRGLVTPEGMPFGQVFRTFLGDQA